MAIGSTSSGVPISVSMGLAAAIPMTISTSPLNTDTISIVLIDFRMLSASFCPMWLDIITLAPIDTPRNRLMSRLITGPLLPTAAKACLLAKCPTTATSTELNICCRTLLAASGSENIRIFMNSGP